MNEYPIKIKYIKILDTGDKKYSEEEAKAIINCLLTLAQIIHKSNFIIKS
jgi:hypothetical protein